VIQNNKLSLIKKAVESKSAVKKLLATERQIKIVFLRKLSAIYHNLLFCLFNQ
jgi:hypothetical protein